MRIVGLTSAGLGRAEDGSQWPRTLPGEEIDAEGRILRPSEQRVAAPCRHFKSCGGCALQHASDAFVASWKTERVTKALSARGLSSVIEVVHTSPAQSRRRASLSGRRTKKGAIVGFHGHRSGTIVEVPECEVLSPSLRKIVPTLAELTTRYASRKGELSFAVTESATGIDLAVVGGPETLTLDMVTDLTALARLGGIARLTWGAETLFTLTAPSQEFGDVVVTPPPGAFLQATKQGERALIDHVLQSILGARRIVDLFSGCGTFSLPAARHAEVHAVEFDPHMLTSLDQAWRKAPGLHRISTEARDLFRRPLLPDELVFDAAVIDPPRAGAEEQVAQLAKSAIQIVAMVSCNPASFARDAQILVKAGFDLGPITIVDQFRWSPHVELAARFTRT